MFTDYLKRHDKGGEDTYPQVVRMPPTTRAWWLALAKRHGASLPTMVRAILAALRGGKTVRLVNGAVVIVPEPEVAK